MITSSAVIKPWEKIQKNLKQIYENYDFLEYDN